VTVDNNYVVIFVLRHRQTSKRSFYHDACQMSIQFYQASMLREFREELHQININR